MATCSRDRSGREKTEQQRPLVNFLKGLKKTNNVFSDEEVSHQACSVFQTAAGFVVTSRAGQPFEFTPRFCIFCRLPAGGAVAPPLVASVLLPVGSVDDMWAVRSVLIAFHPSVFVPAVPVLLLCWLLHAAIASRLSRHGDQGMRGLALALLAVGKGILMLTTDSENGLIFTAV